MDYCCIRLPLQDQMTIQNDEINTFRSAIPSTCRKCDMMTIVGYLSGKYAYLSCLVV